MRANACARSPRAVARPPARRTRNSRRARLSRVAARDVPSAPDDDGWRQLCSAIRRGDEHAFARFYDLWFPRALQLARAVVRGDEATGLDVVQDVMAKVVHKLPALSGERAVVAWMAKTISAAAI